MNIIKKIKKNIGNLSIDKKDITDVIEESTKLKTDDEQIAFINTIYDFINETNKN